MGDDDEDAHRNKTLSRVHCGIFWGGMYLQDWGGERGWLQSLWGVKAVCIILTRKIKAVARKGACSSQSYELKLLLWKCDD